jgi:hypothetical protein
VCGIIIIFHWIVRLRVFFVVSFGVRTSHSILLCYTHYYTGSCATPRVFCSNASASDSIVFDSVVPLFHSPVRTTASHFLLERRPLHFLRLGRENDIHILVGGGAATWGTSGCGSSRGCGGDSEDDNSVVRFVVVPFGRRYPVDIRLLLRFFSLVRLRSLMKHGIDLEARESEGFPDSTASASDAGYWFLVFLLLPLLPRT